MLFDPDPLPLNLCPPGLVAITASCGFVEVWAAAIIGSVAGVLYCAGSYIVLNVLKIDDPLDAVAVHGVNGVWGLLAASAFATPDYLAKAYAGYTLTATEGAHGFIMGGNGRLLAAAVIGIIAITAWLMLTMIPFFLGLKAIGILRVSAEHEMTGLVRAVGGSRERGPEQRGFGRWGGGPSSRLTGRLRAGREPPRRSRVPRRPARDQGHAGLQEGRRDAG